MNKIVLYTTHCPKCRILEKKLTDKGVPFISCEDTTEMQNKGITSVPVLMVNDNMMNYYDAVKYVNSL